MTTELLGTVGIIALISTMVGAYIALMVWDWRKKRARARLEAGAEARGEAFEAMAHRMPGLVKNVVEAGTPVPPTPSVEAIKAARRIILDGGCIRVDCTSDHCPFEAHTYHGDPDDTCDPKGNPALVRTARTWLAERGISVEAPEVGEAH